MERIVHFNFKARYEISGQVTSDTTEVWICLHGYGQLSRYFLPKFAILQSPQRVIVAPEGLSRFYSDPITATGRASNRVGASWMTREARLNDIENYLHYLDAVCKDVLGDHKPTVVLLGFSQGAATACRWAEHTSLEISNLVLWAGIFPEDLQWAFKPSLKITLVYGLQDPFLTPERMAELNRMCEEHKLTPHHLTFEGGHEIPEKVVESLSRWLAEPE